MVFTSFKHPKLPISIKIPVTLLQIVYICMTAISMNYLFANLLVAWLYINLNSGNHSSVSFFLVISLAAHDPRPPRKCVNLFIILRRDKILHDIFGNPSKIRF